MSSLTSLTVLSSKHAIQALNEEIASLTNQQRIYRDLLEGVKSYSEYQRELLANQLRSIDKMLLESREQVWVVTQLLRYSEGELVMQERSAVDVLQ